MIHRVAKKVWGTVEEPKTTTMIVVVAYVVCAVASVSLAVAPTPHPLPSTDVVLTVLGSALLGIGGTIGAPSAWLGKWFVERAAATACAGGSAVMLLDALVLALPGEPDLVSPALSISTAALSVCAFLFRLDHVSKRPYAPGKGPELPEDKTDRIIAQMVSEKRTHGEI